MVQRHEFPDAPAMVDLRLVRQVIATALAGMQRGCCSPVDSTQDIAVTEVSVAGMLRGDLSPISHDIV